MKHEWWLTAAVSDDRLVAELLLGLKDSTTADAAGKNPVLPAWGVRQPRSSVEKKRDARRRSPTTPLSWSAAGSPSDDSSADHPQPSDRFRSKVSASIESQTTSTKRHTKKKTFAELKEEEGSLLKERTHLKKELATLRSTWVEQRSINDTLKRRKLDLPLKSGTNREDNSEPNERNTNENGASSEATSSNASRPVKYEETSEEPNLRSSSQQRRGVASREPIFVLPDLNMTPDEGCGLEGIAGMS